eukprot:g1841.t1
MSRKFCLFEIRIALELKKRLILIHESDPRHNSFDFYKEQMAAPDDLKFLTDEHESMAFRRRGYERDALLHAVIEKAGYKELMETAASDRQEQKDTLAKLPDELRAFDLDQHRDRLIQTEVIELLLLQKGQRGFTSCVLLHGMGGTGKTVAAVAVLQDTKVRRFYRELHWLTVGADAVGSQLKQLQIALYRRLSGKGAKAEEKDEQAWQQMIVAAMTGKERALVVLDDPWMPEQVRFLNPIDSSQTHEHRLLITTRIRDLAPKATRVELPLMGEDEAVALLLDLANIEETSYLKEHSGSAWPPQAALDIAAECGLLPITLTIAAQVMRSWGSGWQEAVLPLLREQRGAGTRTAEERVIGAGLRALERHQDGAAVTKLFHMFAVTQEDFVHPMAVIELLWRSCCASEEERQQSSLTTGLKVRQMTQLLVDHSLLLGSSRDGIHLHDILLSYLRKRLSTEELRAKHLQVVDGMIAVAADRLHTTGRGLLNTGTSNSPHDGEEVDWLEWVVLARAAWNLALGSQEEFSRVKALQEKAALNPALQRDPLALYNMHMDELIATGGYLPNYLNDGRWATEADRHQHLTLSRDVWTPLLKQARDQFRGARKEFYQCLVQIQMVPIGSFPVCHNTKDNTQLVRAFTAAEWGEDSQGLIESMRTQSFQRHNMIARNSIFNINIMPAQAPAAYIAEIEGNLQQMVDAFAMQRKYLEAEFSAVRAFSEDDVHMCNHWMTHGAWASEIAELYPFATSFLRICKLTDLEDVQQFRERYDRWPLMVSMRKAGVTPSKDGMRHHLPTDAGAASFFAAKVLASSSANASGDNNIDLGFVDTLPPPTSPTLWCVAANQVAMASARVMMAEVFVQQGQWKRAITWAQSELAAPINRNLPSKTRAGRILARSHAALGEHELSAAALSAALDGATMGALLLSEALTVREMVKLGKTAAAEGNSHGPYWAELEGEQRLLEVAGRMVGGLPGAGGRALVEALLRGGEYAPE